MDLFFFRRSPGGVEEPLVKPSVITPVQGRIGKGKSGPRQVEGLDHVSSVANQKDDLGRRIQFKKIFQVTAKRGFGDDSSSGRAHLFEKRQRPSS